MTNPVLADTGPLSGATAIHLELHNGDEIATRGTAANLGETESQLTQYFVRSGVCAWVPLPRGFSDGDSVSHVRLGGSRYRVLSRVVLGDPAMWGFVLELRLIHRQEVVK